MKLIQVIVGCLLVMSTLPVSAQSFNEDEKIYASDEGSGKRFGYSSAVSGSIAAIGSVKNGPVLNPPGSVYIINTETGEELHKLMASDSGLNDRFGFSVAMTETHVVVGAPRRDDGSGGAAYVFDLITGQQLHKLTPVDPFEFNQFGYSVSISETTVVVGAIGYSFGDPIAGSVYLFDIETGQQLLKLSPSDSQLEDEFGRSVAISGSTVLVGSASNSAYVFDATTGMQTRQLTGLQVFSGLGLEVAISSSRAVVFADSSNVSLYRTDTWEQIASLSRPGPPAGIVTQFGYSLAISDSTALVGSRNDRVDRDSETTGLAYFYDAENGDYLARLEASDGDDGDSFGLSVAVSESTAIVGAPTDTNFFPISGSAYQFNISFCKDNPANITGDQSVDFFDISAFITAFSNQDPIADFTGDGIVDFFDISAFIKAFQAQCL